MQHLARPSHAPTTVEATTFPSTFNTHSLRTHLYDMANSGLAMTALLQDAFRRFYGDGWEEAYKQPKTSFYEKSGRS